MSLITVVRSCEYEVRQWCVNCINMPHPVMARSDSDAAIS